MSKDTKTKSSKTVKDTKEPKEVKNVDDEKKKANKETSLIGATLNVTKVTYWLKNFLLHNRDMAYEEKMTNLKIKKNKEKQDKNDTTDEDDNSTDDEKGKSRTEFKIKIGGAHYALALSDEVICVSLVNLTKNTIKKSVGGLYMITEDDLTNAVRLNKDANYAFCRCLLNYDAQQNYIVSLNYTEKELVEFVEKYAFGVGCSNVKLETKAINLLSYLMVQNRIMLSVAGCQMMMYAKSSTITYESIMASINIHYQGTLRKDLIKKLEEKLPLVKSKGKKKDKSDKSDKGDKDEDDDEEEEEDDVVDKKNKKGTDVKAKVKDTKGSKTKGKAKGKKKPDSDDESEESEESDSD